MREIFQQTHFKKDIKKIKNSGKHNLKELLEIVEMLSKNQKLSVNNHDHSLVSNWKEFRECHIRPDWLLVYKLEPNKLILVRTGTHSDIFG